MFQSASETCEECVLCSQQRYMSRLCCCSAEDSHQRLRVALGDQSQACILIKGWRMVWVSLVRVLACDTGLC